MGGGGGDPQQQQQLLPPPRAPRPRRWRSGKGHGGQEEAAEIRSSNSSFLGCEPAPRAPGPRRRRSREGHGGQEEAAEIRSSSNSFLPRGCASFSGCLALLPTRLPCVRSTIERYKKASASTSWSAPVIDVNSHQYFQQEAAKLRHQIQTLQNANRHLVGDSIGNMTPKELKSLENRLERGIGRIRSKKHELLFAEIEYMQKREADLQSENLFLRAKVAETERAQQQQQQQAEGEMVPAMAGGTELDALPTFDARGYYPPVNMLAAAAAAAASQYSDHHQTALHLGYHIKVDSAAGKGLL